MALPPPPPGPDALPLAPPSDAAPWLTAVVMSAGIASIAGTALGLLLGGIGGRIAMRILFLTTGDSVRGLMSDDGFEIGRFTASTIILLIFAAIAGAIAGAAYGLIRTVTAGPTWVVALGVSVAAGLGEGAVLVTTEGVDFRLLEPLWLAIALFVLIPAVWGASVVLLTQRLLRPGTLFGIPPAEINRVRFGAVGWLVLAGIAVAGALDLLSDIDRLA